MKVGRAALDEDAIRLLEELNPGVEFDWTRILKSDASSAEQRAPVPQRRAERQQKRAAENRENVPPDQTSRDSVETNVLVSASTDAELRSAIEPSPGVEPGADMAPSLSPTAAHARLGTEGVMRLRGRYAEILARISERIQDPVRKDELKTQADHLNPDTWVTDEEVRIGLEQYESVFEALRAVVGRRRRRRRRRGGRKEGSAAAPGAAPESGGDPHGTEAEDAEDSDGPEGA